MAANRRPRKAYRPRPVVRDTMAFVRKSLTPLRDHDDYVLNWKSSVHGSMHSLVRGIAVQQDVDSLLAAHHVCEALLKTGMGADYRQLLVASSAALRGLTDRAAQLGRFSVRETELAALNDMIDLHDALMEHVTVGQIDKALVLAKSEILAGRARRKIPAAQATAA